MFAPTPFSRRVRVSNKFLQNFSTFGSSQQAKFNEDGQFYPAKVLAASPDYHFLVEFEGYGDKQVVSQAEIRQMKQGEDAGYKPTQAPKRRRVEENTELPTEIPKHLLIKETDDEKTKEK